MPVMSTRGSISVRFANHLIPKPPVVVGYRVATTPGDTGTTYTTSLVTTSSGSYTIPYQAMYTTPGRYTWICPPGVTSISAMCVGGGGGGGIWGGSYAGANGGGGGGYAYMYNYTVTPGASYTIQVGAGGETTERYGGQYWDAEDDGTLYDKSGSGRAGGIASWFNSRTTCRGGGGTNGQAASWNGSSYTTSAYAWGGYWTLGAGISGSGLAGGFSDQPVNGASGPPSFCGGGAAGTSSTKGGFDTAGSGSYYSGASYSGGSTGGGGGGGGGYSASGGTRTINPISGVTGWSSFMIDYVVWTSNLGVLGAADSIKVTATWTASYTGTYHFHIAADNTLSVYIDDVLACSTTNSFSANPEDDISVTVSEGTHTLRFEAASTESYAGFAVVIKSSNNISIVWDTRTNLYGATVYPTRYTGAGGGGIGLMGITATSPGSGAVGSIATSSTAATGGGGGSGGQAGYNGEDISYQAGTATSSNGGKYGGGGGAGKTYNGRGAAGGHGAVRVTWKSGAAYPSTNLSDYFTYITIPVPAPRTYLVVQNEQLYDTPGAYYWICPAGVTSVCVLCIGGGGSENSYRPGGGGAYAYINNYPTTPGQGYLVVVGAGGYIGLSNNPNSLNTSVSYGSAPRASGTGYNGNAFNTPNYATFYSGADSPINARTGGDGSYFVDFTTVFAGGGENGYGGYDPSNPGRYVYGGYGGVGYYNPAYTGGGQRGGGGWYNASKYQAGSVSPYASPTAVYGGGGGAGNGGAFGDSGAGPAGTGSAGNGYDSTFLTGDGSHTEAGVYYASGGGGMGVYGIATTGADGSQTFSNSKATYGSGGVGGSGGQPGTGGKLQTSGGGPGGKYGGGAGAGNYNANYGYALGQGASGAVRIIWGAGRTFPNTSTASVITSVSF